MNISRMVSKLFGGIVICLVLIGQCDCKYVKAQEKVVLDISNCSVSSTQTVPGDIVTWKIKPLQDLGRVNICLELKTPIGTVIMAAYPCGLVPDASGCYMVDYCVPKIGAGNGEYQIHKISIWKYNTDEHVTVSSLETDSNYQDMTSLSFEVNNQVGDTTAPNIDKENVSVNIANGCAHIEVPVIEDGSGLQEIDVEIRYYDSVAATWEEDFWRGYFRGGFTEKKGKIIIDEEISIFEEGKVYGLSYIEVIDVAGNQSRIDFMTEEGGLNTIPSKWCFSVENSMPSVGEIKKESSGQYKVTKSSGKAQEVAFVKPKSSKKTSVIIPATIKINGYTYKVTEISSKAFKNNKKIKSVTIGKNVKKIGKEAFYNCKKLKKITIKGSGLKSVGKNAIKNIDKKATIKVPKKQLSKYKKLFKNETGYKKTMKIKK